MASGYDHTISGLLHKRAVMAGQIEHLQAQLRQLVIDLDNLDCTLRLFDPDIDLTEIKAKPLPPRHHAFRGELSRVVLDTLRNSSKPLTSQDLALKAMSLRGLNLSDKRLVKLMVKRVGACLRNARQGGIVRSTQGPGDYMLWEIAR